MLMMPKREFGMPDWTLAGEGGYLSVHRSLDYIERNTYMDVLK